MPQRQPRQLWRRSPDTLEALQVRSCAFILVQRCRTYELLTRTRYVATQAFAL